MELDEDLAAMTHLSEAEKDGVQYYRNFHRKILEKNRRDFCEKIDEEEFDIAPVEQIVTLIENDDIRFLPVVACSFADDQLKAMFRRKLPSDVPGGIKDLLNFNGPLGGLANRIRIAYAFNSVSADILKDLDKLRDARNKISHNWNITAFARLFEEEPLKHFTKVHEMICDKKSARGDPAQLGPELAFRTNVIWVITRLAYECPIFMDAQRALLNPHTVLYGIDGVPAPKRLTTFSKAANAATNRLLQRK